MSAQPRSERRTQNRVAALFRDTLGYRRLGNWSTREGKDLLEYLVVHEILHLIAPTHSEQFLMLMSKHYPSWREARAELNELPLAAEAWNA